MVQLLLFLVTTPLEIMVFTCLTSENTQKYSWSTKRQDQGGEGALGIKGPVDNKRGMFVEEKGPVSQN